MLCCAVCSSARLWAWHWAARRGAGCSTARAAASRCSSATRSLCCSASRALSRRPTPGFSSRAFCSASPCPAPRNCTPQRRNAAPFRSAPNEPLLQFHMLPSSCALFCFEHFQSTYSTVLYTQFTLSHSLTLVLEFTKVNLRAAMAMGCQLPWALGFCVFSALAYFTMNQYGWRVFLLLLFFPFLIFVLVSFLVCKLFGKFLLEICVMIYE